MMGHAQTMLRSQTCGLARCWWTTRSPCEWTLAALACLHGLCGRPGCRTARLGLVNHPAPDFRIMRVLGQGAFRQGCPSATSWSSPKLVMRVAWQASQRHGHQGRAVLHGGQCYAVAQTVLAFWCACMLELLLLPCTAAGPAHAKTPCCSFPSPAGLQQQPGWCPWH